MLFYFVVLLYKIDNTYSIFLQIKMGIDKLCEFFKDAAQIIQFSDKNSQTRGLRVLVDASKIIYQYGIGIRKQLSDKVDKDNKVVNHLYAIAQYAATLLRKGMYPIFVFDGKSPASKKKVLEKRTNERNRANLKCSQMIEKDNTKKNSISYAQNFKKSYSYNSNDVSECKQLLTAMGLKWIQSEAESDTQCAKMFNEVDAVVTEDSDILTLGCDIFRGVTGSKTEFMHYKFESVLESFKIKIISILEEAPHLIETLNNIKFNLNRQELHVKLIEFGAMLGCDKNEGLIKAVRRIGFENSKKSSHTALSDDLKYDVNELLKIYVLSDLNIRQTIIELFKKIGKNINLNNNEDFEMVNKLQETFGQTVIAYNAERVRPNIELNFSGKMTDPDYENLVKSLLRCGFNYDFIHSLFLSLERTYAVFKHERKNHLITFCDKSHDYDMIVNSENANILRRVGDLCATYQEKIKFTKKNLVNVEVLEQSSWTTRGFINKTKNSKELNVQTNTKILDYEDNFSKNKLIGAVF